MTYNKPRLFSSIQVKNNIRRITISINNLSNKDNFLYFWFKDNNLLNNEENSVLEVNSVGSYFCEIRNYLNEVIITDTLIISNTGVSEIEFTEKVKFYFAENSLKSEIDILDIGPISIKLFDIYGNLILEYNSIKSDRVFMNTYEGIYLSPGVYFTETIINNRRRIVRKIKR